MSSSTSTFPKAAGPIGSPSDLERHLVHDAKHNLAGGLGDLKIVGVKAAEHVARQTFIEQGGCEQIDDAALERAQIGGADGGDEEREQRARVGDQETLAPVEPEQVRIPVVALWRRLDQPDRLLPEQIEQLGAAADDHLPRA